MKENVRWCVCMNCGKPMSLGWDDDDNKYVAVCEPCKVYQPINDHDHPPRTI